jgi:hypothetical protein
MGTTFAIRSAQIGYKEEFNENRKSSSGVPSEQLVEIWALQGRLRRWRYVMRCGVLNRGKLKNLHCVNYVAKKRLVETVID